MGAERPAAGIDVRPFYPTITASPRRAYFGGRRMMHDLTLINSCHFP
jgi:hypothetical protein